MQSCDRGLWNPCHEELPLKPPAMQNTGHLYHPHPHQLPSEEITSLTFGLTRMCVTSICSSSIMTASSFSPRLQSLCHVYARLPTCTTRARGVSVMIEKLSSSIMCVMSNDSICFSHTFNILYRNESLWMIRRVFNYATVYYSPCVHKAYYASCVCVCGACVEYNVVMM